jgi:hypothetical protein
MSEQFDQEFANVTINPPAVNIPTATPRNSANYKTEVTVNKNCVLDQAKIRRQIAAIEYQISVLNSQLAALKALSEGSWTSCDDCCL